MKTVLAILILLLAPAVCHAQISAPQLWKARALEGADKLKVLNPKLDAFRDRWNSQAANEFKCEVMLETAFTMHLTHESIVHKILKNGTHAFKLVLNGGEQGLFDLTYIYDPKSWEIISMEILSLPRAWELIQPTGARSIGGILLSVKDTGDADPRCVFGFSRDSPFFAHVTRSNK